MKRHSDSILAELSDLDKKEVSRGESCVLFDSHILVYTGESFEMRALDAIFITCNPVVDPPSF